MFRPRSLALHLLVCTLLVGPGLPDSPTARAAASNAPPEIQAPATVNVFPYENVHFYIDATDPEGEPTEITVIGGLPPESFFHIDNEGRGVLYVVASPRLVGKTYPVTFHAKDAQGVGTSFTTQIVFLQARGENAPTLFATSHFTAPAGVRSELIVQVDDPDGDELTFTADAFGALETSVQRVVGGSYRVYITPTAEQKGQQFPLLLSAADPQQNSASREITVTVPRDGEVEIVRMEVRWLEPEGDDPFAPPEGVEAFDAPETPEALRTDPGDILSYVIYVGESENFELSSDKVAGVAPPTWLNGVVTLVLPAAKAHRPRHVKCTVRRANGESKPSKETSTDTPRFPGTPVYKKGKLILPIVSSNIQAGALLEVRTAAASEGDRFAIGMNKKGTKWIIKRSAQSTTSDRRLKDVVKPGQAVILLLVNANGRASQPFPFVPGS